MANMLILGLIGLLITGSVAIPIDTRLEDYCKALLAIYEKDPESDIVQGIIEPWMCRSLDAMEESDYFLPKVLIWCPLTRFNLPLKCPEHKNTLRTGNWKVSTKMSSEPRLLFDLNGNTLLVARYYVCSSSGIYHRILSSDQLLLEQVQKDLEVPFILSHRSGYTLRFLTHVRVEIGLGINFNDISTSLMKMNYENFMKRRQLMQLLFEHNGKQPSTKYLDKKEFHENPLYSYPSDDHIREMFLMNFRQTKSIYEGDMKKLSARSVSMFHSFKVCSRVGTTRSSDEKWVSGHACLFVVLNELGEIIKWSFCEGDSLDEVKVLLHELSARFSVQGRLLSHIMVGPCCEWRPRLMEIFGGNVLIKQDLHHAVEGLRENLNMQNAVLKACLADFDLVFRDLDDQGQERSKPTPSPQVLKSHLEQFLMKWRDSLSPEAVKRLKAMEEHIHRGCFSGIPPGHGVKKSADLNELLNKSLVTGATRVGPELAFALITVLFYIMNGKLRRTKQLYERCHPQSPTELDGESFGFLPSGSSVLSPIVSNSLAPQNGQQIQSGEVANLLTTDVLQVLVPEALELHDMLHNLSSRITQNGKTINVWEWPSVRPEKALFLLSCRSFPAEDDSDAAEHTMRLTERLEQFNLDLEPVDQDGNCAFSSLALQIRRVLEVGSDPEYNQYLAALGLKETLNLPDMAKCLRFLFVREITANMSEYYPSTHSLTEEMFLEEARSFQFNGVYTSQLGDFMMKALSKMLCCAIVIITSMPSVEVIPFIPPIIKCKTPLFVAHNQRGSGHYDSTVDKPDSDGTSDSGGNNNRYASTKGKCRCGRGKHSGGENVISCTNNSGRGKYLTRCPCHRLQQGCTKMCKCLNCGNEFTTAAAIADMTSQKVMKRKRNVAASKKRKKGEDFINELRQQTPASQTAWSPFESCVFESSLRFLTYSGIELSTENVLQMYNFIAKSTPVSTMGLELRGKTFTQIEVKLSSRQESVPVAGDITITYALDDINGENFT